MLEAHELRASDAKSGFSVQRLVVGKSDAAWCKECRLQKD